MFTTTLTGWVCLSLLCTVTENVFGKILFFKKYKILGNVIFSLELALRLLALNRLPHQKNFVQFFFVAWIKFFPQEYGNKPEFIAGQQLSPLQHSWIYFKQYPLHVWSPHIRLRMSTFGRLKITIYLFILLQTSANTNFMRYLGKVYSSYSLHG